MWKDTFREIWNSKTRFLSIFAIILLGVAFFAGLTATGPVMKESANQYFNEYNLMDLQVQSTYGLAEEDINILEENLNNAVVEGQYTIDAVFEGTEDTVKLFGYSGDQDVNNYIVQEGRLPENSGEIALDSNETFTESYSIGDTITIDQNTGDNFEENLSQLEFEVVGFVQNPRYVENTSRGNTTVGSGVLNGFGVIPEEDIDMQVMTEANISFDQTNDMDVYSQEYQDFISNKTSEIEPLLEQRGQERLEQIRNDAEQEIEDGRRQLQEGREQLNSAEQELQQGREQLDQGWSSYESGRQELEQQRSIVQAEFDQRRQQIEAGRVQLNQTQLGSARAQLDQSEQQLNQAEAQAQSQFEGAEARLEEAYSQLVQGEAEYQEGLAAFQEESEGAYQQLTEGEQSIQEAEDNLNNLSAPGYFINDFSSFLGHSGYGDNAERIQSIATIFPVFFVLLAILISLTTMSRMVDEERNQIGTMKALGYSNGQIATKYFVYAFIATVLGALLGLALGYWLFPTVIMDAYGSMYNMTNASIRWFWGISIISIVGSIAATGGATLYSLRSLLKNNAATLLRPKAPKKGKRIFLEKIPFIWNKMSFTQKVSSRNLFRYKGRMFMTIVGVAGGMALLLTGFGLSDSISNVSPIQFGELYQYEATVSRDTEAGENQQSSLNQTLDEMEAVGDWMNAYQESVTVEGENSEQPANITVPEEPERINDFILLRDYQNPEQTHELPNEGAVITQKLAELMGVSEGDSITVVDSENQEYEVPVSGVAEHYVQHYIYMSPEAYSNLTGNNAESNQSLLSYGDQEVTEEDEEAMANHLSEEEAALAVILQSDIIEGFENSLNSLNVVTIVLIISAGALAFIVLYNLTNINVSERVRELSTIKVLGFYDTEVTKYVYRENFSLTIMGIVVGYVLGIIMHRFVLNTAEVDVMKFATTINFPSYIWATLLMLLFSTIVMIFMHFKLKNIDMVEALKTED